MTILLNGIAVQNLPLAVGFLNAGISKSKGYVVLAELGITPMKSGNRSILTQEQAQAIADYVIRPPPDGTVRRRSEAGSTSNRPRATRPSPSPRPRIAVRSHPDNGVLPEFISKPRCLLPRYIDGQNTGFARLLAERTFPDALEHNVRTLSETALQSLLGGFVFAI